MINSPNKLNWSDAVSDLIKWSLAMTTAPKWIGALNITNGVIHPLWLDQMWPTFSTVMSATMAVVEAFALSYMASAWSRKNDKSARNFLIATILTYTFFLFPYVLANTHGISVSDVIGTVWWSYLWSFDSIIIAGITIVGVGYCQKTYYMSAIENTKEIDEKDNYNNNGSDDDYKVCWCGYIYKGDKKEHRYSHVVEAWEEETVLGAIEMFRKKYGVNIESDDIIQMLKEYKNGDE